MRHLVPPPLESYQAVLFDMNGTFMFEGDRFGSTQDYHATYQEAGGRALSRGEVQAAVHACYTAFLRDYDDPGLVECFPSLDEFVAIHAGVPVCEREAIATTIARHEVGKVPDWAAHSMLCVARRTTVGVVSNVWAPSFHWNAELVASGVASVLAAAIFSADVGAIKPSPRPFLAALKRIGVSSQAALFVGDSLERDIVPAKMLGMSTCLVGEWAPGVPAIADFHVHSIAQLAV